MALLLVFFVVVGGVAAPFWLAAFGVVSVGQAFGLAGIDLVAAVFLVLAAKFLVTPLVPVERNNVPK